MARVHSAQTSSRLRQHTFWGDYRLPLVLSVAFVGLVACAGGVRIYQREALAKLLTQVATVGQNYTSLLSNDKTNPVIRNNANTLNTASAGSTQGGSFSVAPGSTGTQTGTGGTGGSGSSSSQTPPFTAAITSFTQGSVTLECSSGRHNKAKCSKRYAFSALVSAQHGPGTVQYGWRSNWQAAIGDNSYSAASGSTQQTLTTSMLIPCLDPGTYNLQFVLTSPVQVQSPTLSFTHSCAGI